MCFSLVISFLLGMFLKPSASYFISFRVYMFLIRFHVYIFFPPHSNFLESSTYTWHHIRTRNCIFAYSFPFSRPFILLFLHHHFCHFPFFIIFIQFCVCVCAFISIVSVPISCVIMCSWSVFISSRLNWLVFCSACVIEIIAICIFGLSLGIPFTPPGGEECNAFSQWVHIRFKRIQPEAILRWHLLLITRLSLPEMKWDVFHFI